MEVSRGAFSTVTGSFQRMPVALRVVGVGWGATGHDWLGVLGRMLGLACGSQPRLREAFNLGGKGDRRNRFCVHALASAWSALHSPGLLCMMPPSAKIVVAVR